MKKEMGVYEGRALNEAEMAKDILDRVANTHSATERDAEIADAEIAKAQVHASLSTTFAILAHGVSLGFRLGGIEQAIKEAGGQV